MKLGWRFWIAIGSVFFLCIAFIFAAYLFDWTGTGFKNKTFWDWLQLLIVPLALAIIAFLFNRAMARTEQRIANQRILEDRQIAEKRYQQEQEIAEKRYEQDKQIAAQRYMQNQHIALDKQREDLLQNYLDRMSELLLEKQLFSSKPFDEVRNVARVRTITILFQLDARRIGYVFAFLHEAGLISTISESIVSLRKANLSQINLSQATIGEVDLSRANLSYAKFNGADLSGANLSGVNFFVTDLNGANLSGANLSGAKFIYADLSGANLSKANLSGANFVGADLDGACLNGADLNGADFFGTDLDHTALERTKIQQVKGLTESEIEVYKSRGAII